jgi:uncharacterized membrane protein YfcA
MRIKQTRWKLAIIAMGLFLMEAILKMLIAEFPLTELLTAQGLVVGAYLGAKTTNNIKERISVQND